MSLTWWRARWARSCDGDVLNRLAGTWDPALAVLLVAENPHVRKKHLKSLAAIEDARVRSVLVSHPKCPKRVLRDSVQYGGEMVRAALARRHDLPEEVQMRLASDHSPFVRAALACNQSVCDEFRVLAALR